MILKIVDKGGMEYPEVVNAETGERVERIIKIAYSASAFGRVCRIEFIGETDIERSFVLESVETGDNHE